VHKFTVALNSVELLPTFERPLLMHVAAAVPRACRQRSGRSCSRIIDYYAFDMDGGSEDPANPSVTLVCSRLCVPMSTDLPVSKKVLHQRDNKHIGSPAMPKLPPVRTQLNQNTLFELPGLASANARDSAPPVLVRVAFNCIGC
jgi:hypothetical protein